MVYTDPDDVPWTAYLVLAGSFAVIVAALLPWHVAGGDPKTGLDLQNGNLTAGVALAALGLLVAYEWGLVARIGALLAGIVTVRFGYDIWTQVESSARHDPRVGLYLTLLGGAMLLAAPVYSAVESYVLADESGDATDRSAR